MAHHFHWPVGQAVKTPPFHGGNTGSNPVRVTIILFKQIMNYFANAINESYFAKAS